MKNNLSLQTSLGSNTSITEQGPFSCIHLAKKNYEYINNSLPATVSMSIGPVTSKKKIPGSETRLNSSFNLSLKLIAPRLSEIELALDCYNVSNLQYSTLALRDLFFDVKMPAVYQLAVQMEELARENQVQEVKNLLRAIKKIIGQLVKHSEKQRD